MRILFLTSAHNSLSQRLWIELGDLGHEIRVCVAATGEAMIAAVSREVPELIIAPMLKIAIPAEVWSRHLCLIVHPGIKGDRGPSSLDWAIANHEKIWGVTILEAAAEFDAGPIWASHEFAVAADAPAKSSLYRGQVTEAAVRGVLEAVARIESGEFRSGSWQPQKLSDVAPHGSPALGGCLRPPMRQADRAIDWMQDSTALIVRKIRAADSAPGVLGTLLGKTCFLYGAHEEAHLQGPPGKALARRDGAICIGTVDGAVWNSHLKAKAEARADIGYEFRDAEQYPVTGIKLPATQVLGPLLRGVPKAPLPIDAPAGYRTFREIVYSEVDQVGYLSFDFYNGAMTTSQCYRLRNAFLHARSRPTRVIALLGGADFWSNGIDLNAIEACADPAAESWRNINAIDDLIFEILNTMSHFVIAGLRRQCRSRRRDAGARGGPRLCALRGRPQPPLQEHGRSLRIGILDLYAAAAGGAEARAGADPVLPPDRHAGGTGDGISRRRIRRGYRGVRGRAAGAGETPCPGSGIPRDASEEAREASRRRIRQAPRELSRQRAGTDAGQFLRTRSLLSRGPPALRLQGESAAAGDQSAD
jgi:putative two-component system hydrogenase maturation factor HypX/HoxX